MKCKTCSVIDYFEGLENCVGTDYGDKIEFYATSLALMDALAEHEYIDCGSSSKLANMVCSGCAACPSNMLSKREVSTLAEKVGEVFRSAALFCLKC